MTALWSKWGNVIFKFPSFIDSRKGLMLCQWPLGKLEENHGLNTNHHYWALSLSSRYLLGWVIYTLQLFILQCDYRVYYYYSHCIDEQTEVNCSLSHSRKMVEPGIKPRSIWLHPTSTWRPAPSQPQACGRGFCQLQIQWKVQWECGEELSER